MLPLHRSPHRELSHLATLLAAARISPLSAANAAVNGAAARRQRRYSSSKPSSSSNGDALPPAPAKQSSEAPAAPSRKRGGSRAASKVRRSGAGAAKAGKHNQHQHQQSQQMLHGSLPSVPETAHLDSQAVTLASFFSLYRPISVSSPVPPASTQEAFGAIFKPKPRSSATSNSVDTVMTLSSTVRVLDRAISSVENDAADQKNITLGEDTDGNAVIVNLQELAGSFRPFHPPPPPVPFDEFVETGLAKSDTVRVLQEETELRSIAQSFASVVPFGQRMRARRAAATARRAVVLMKAAGSEVQQPSWRAISVRRQRKLKMKKHKYKKLRKRQQNERRRLDRL